MAEQQAGQAGGPVRSPTPPRLLDLLNEHARFALRNAYFTLPGEIQAYDHNSTTASVKIMIKRVVNEETQATIDYPLLLDVPVLQLMGGDGGVNMPIAAGDPCLLVFGDRDISNWYATGSSQAPESKRSHDLSDGFVIVGFRPSTKPFGAPDPNAASLFKGSAQVSCKGGKCTMKNGSTALLTLIETLIDTLVVALSGSVHPYYVPPGWKGDPQYYPDTLATLTALKADFEELLYA